jgi:hypothetical protein
MEVIMIDWQPIETFHKLKKRPTYAAFYFPETESGRTVLPPMVQMTFNRGLRVCTHWLPLPAPPAAEEPS